MQKFDVKHKEAISENKNSITLRIEMSFSRNVTKYCIENSDKVLAYQRIWQSTKIHCETCDCEFRRDNVTKHNKSKKHTDNLTKRNDE